MRYTDSKEYKKFIWTFLEGLYKTYCYFTLKETGQLPIETQAIIARTIKSMWAEFEKENAGFIESAYEKDYHLSYNAWAIIYLGGSNHA